MKFRLSISDIFVFTILVAWSMYVQTSERFDDLKGHEKVYIAFWASGLCWLWRCNMLFSEHRRNAILRKANQPEEVPDKLGEAILTLMYGLPGVPAGCQLGWCIFRPTPANLFGVFFWTGIYLFTHLLFITPKEIIIENLQGRDGDGI